MEKIIIIRTTDPDGSIFKSIVDILQSNNVELIDAVSSAPSRLLIGNIEICPAYHQVLLSGKEVLLNHGEYAMLYCMAKAPGRVYTREQLYAAAWENEVYPYGSNTVDNTIFRLRQKLEPDPKHPVYIKTVFRAGYKVEDPSRR